MKQKNIRAEERAFQILSELIRIREIRPGERVYETELALRFGMSRTPLRTALGRLVAEGLLEKFPGQKGYVLPKLTGQDMEDVFSARAALEGMAATIFIEKATKEALVELREIISMQKELFDSGSKKGEYARLNSLFHFALVKGGGNKYIQRAFGPIYWRSIMYTFLYASFYTEVEDVEPAHPRRRPSWEQHGEIVDTIERGDKLETRALVEKHVLENREYWKAEECVKNRIVQGV